MALIKCPRCGKEFSDRAASCPQCGMSINEIRPILEATEKRAELQDRITKIVMICLSSLAFVMIILSLIYLITNS